VSDEEGKSGAMRMVEDGVAEGLDFVIAQHIDPHSPVGTVSISAGPASGGVDSWFGTIYGKGGHAAHPDKAIDTFYLTAHVILALNAIVSRRLDPFATAAVSIGSVNGGFTENVIPDSVRITGTFRYADPKLHPQIREEILRAFEIARTLGGDYELEFEYGGPPMINDEHVASVIRAAAGELIGNENVYPMRKTLGAEDFGSFMEHAPGAMFNLGVQKEGHEDYPLHHPKFDLDERALPIGTAVLVETALRFLKNDRWSSSSE